MSRFWTVFFRVFYRMLRLIDPLVSGFYRAFGIGNTFELAVRGRRTGEHRTVLLGLLRVSEQRYIGHPNGWADWTLNLEAAGTAELVLRDGSRTPVRAVRLRPGPERESVIHATWHQHPFPGNVLYWLARNHIRAAGVFFRLEGPT